jgi:hypothetical protein
MGEGKINLENDAFQVSLHTSIVQKTITIQKLTSSL